MYAFLLLCVFIAVTSADFSSRCNVGCVNNASWWKANTASWPASCVLRLNSTICGNNVSNILDAYTSDTYLSPDVVVQWIAARANICSGACVTTSVCPTSTCTAPPTSGAILNLQADMDSANGGGAPTTYTVNGCANGYSTYRTQLNSNSFSRALGRTLFQYNTGQNFGPCTCGKDGCTTFQN